MSATDLDPGPPGLNEEIVREMSRIRGEPDWMLDYRLTGYRAFEKHPMPDWAGDTGIRFDDVVYDIKPIDGQADSRADVPEAPMDESELAARHRSEVLERQGVVFTDMGTALREFPELVKPHFATIIQADDNKFSALNTSVWSGGSFVYVPPGVEVDLPLETNVRISAERSGQFDRTLIIADEGSKVHYIEGCSAPIYTANALHSGIVEVVVKPHAHVTCTTVQNWSSNVFNLVTKRAWVEAEGHMGWIDGDIGGRLTMKHPAVHLAGPKATGEVHSVAYAGRGQHQDTGAEMVHLAPETTSKVVSRSISKDGGRSSFRGLVRVEADAYGCTSDIESVALVLDADSVSDIQPYLEIGAADARIGRDVRFTNVADEQLFYLMSRGLSEEQAIGVVVNGFIEPVTRTLPMEYAVEWSRLIEWQMEGSIG